jgi:hypothetical protein
LLPGALPRQVGVTLLDRRDHRAHRPHRIEHVVVDS